ncbi:MAG: ERAP1-like C-terminal domain-containing protein [Oligoflexia bacterium]|nr:ERAP1-like C-terminal domain-containing protein [Oligoflexia bacterium]
MSHWPSARNTLAVPLLGSLLLSACASPNVPPKESPSITAPENPVGPRSTLTHEEAQTRSRQILRPTYNLWFGLDADHDDYEGRAVINFDLRPKARDASKTVFLDFEQGTIRSVTLNGVHLESPDYDGYRLRFRTAELAPQTNRIEIAFSRAYATTGGGLRKFKDPQDGLAYAYTALAPFAAQRIFPCFDQPDLRASFEVTVEAPQDWQVISSTLERETVTAGERRSWAFPPSPLLGTQGFTLHAGPYKTWKGSAEGIPLRLLSRRSVSGQVDAEEWFRTARHGLDYYSVQFGYPYPYSKFDQLIVPAAGDTVLSAAATASFAESLAFRPPAETGAKHERAKAILRQLAHNWFGNLVTVRWWNGTWLTEGLATFLSTEALARATGPERELGPLTHLFEGGSQVRARGKAAWEEFFLLKLRAYEQDADRAAPAGDPSAEKAGALLKQLSFQLGEDEFRDGVQRFFLRYALRSVSPGDFFKMLTEASARDLSRWRGAWLRGGSMNTVRAEWACEDDKITRFVLIQGGSEPRPHRTKVALYRLPRRAGSARALEPNETLEVAYAQAKTPVPAALKKRCPDLVFPNHDDLDYVSVELDPTSLATAQLHLASVSDTLARRMLWHSLRDMALSGKFAASDFTALALKLLPRERDPGLVLLLCGWLWSPASAHRAVATQLPAPEREKFLEQLDSLLLRSLEHAPPRSELQLAWLEAFTNAVSTKSGLETARAFLEGRRKIPGLPLSTEQRARLQQRFPGTPAVQ